MSTWKQALATVLPSSVEMAMRARFGDSREPELDLLRDLVHRGDTVIDIGAHKGVYTYWLSRLAGPNGHVLAYEPQPDLATFLREALTTRRSANVELRTVALSATPGLATMTIPVVDHEKVIGQASLEAIEAGSQISIEIECRVLDDESFPALPRFIKCDVEGHEFKVLSGGTRLLAEARPHILVEIEQRHAGDEALETFALVRAAGYVAFYLDVKGELRSLPATPATRVSGLNYPDGSRYVNNFLFVHASRLNELARR
jgi:FkbM family methyltransferase